MAGLDNTIKDLIGSLRAVIFLLTLWNIEQLRFPLDKLVRTGLAKYHTEHEELLVLATDISQLVSVYRDLRSAIDDIVIESEEMVYQEHDVNLLLSVYARSPSLRRFTYADRRILELELRDITASQLAALFDSMLWLRANYYDIYPMALLRPNPKERMLRFVDIIRDVSPELVVAANPHSFLMEILNNWLNSQSVITATDRTAHEDYNGLKRVIQELYE